MFCGFVVACLFVIGYSKEYYVSQSIGSDIHDCSSRTEACRSLARFFKVVSQEVVPDERMCLVDFGRYEIREEISRVGIDDSVFVKCDNFTTRRSDGEGGNGCVVEFSEKGAIKIQSVSRVAVLEGFSFEVRNYSQESQPSYLIEIENGRLLNCEMNGVVLEERTIKMKSILKVSSIVGSKFHDNNIFGFADFFLELSTNKEENVAVIDGCTFIGNEIQDLVTMMSEEQSEIETVNIFACEFSKNILSKEAGINGNVFYFSRYEGQPVQINFNDVEIEKNKGSAFQLAGDRVELYLNQTRIAENVIYEDYPLVAGISCSDAPKVFLVDIMSVRVVENHFSERKEVLKSNLICPTQTNYSSYVCDVDFSKFYCMINSTFVDKDFGSDNFPGDADRPMKSMYQGLENVIHVTNPFLYVVENIYVLKDIEFEKDDLTLIGLTSVESLPKIEGGNFKIRGYQCVRMEISNTNSVSIDFNSVELSVLMYNSDFSFDSVSISDVVFEGNTFSSEGFGIKSITHSFFSFNSMLTISDDVHISRSVFSENNYPVFDVVGNGKLSLQGSYFSRNHAHCIVVQDGSVDIISSFFLSNEMTTLVGSCTPGANISLSVVDSTFTDNMYDTIMMTSLVGGGDSSCHSNLYLDSSTFSSNNKGCALNLENNNTFVTLTETSIVQNSCQGCFLPKMAGIKCLGNPRVAVENNRIEGNLCNLDQGVECNFLCADSKHSDEVCTWIPVTEMENVECVDYSDSNNDGLQWYQYLGIVGLLIGCLFLIALLVFLIICGIVRCVGDVKSLRIVKFRYKSIQE